jgi:hypothetical protein
MSRPRLTAFRVTVAVIVLLTLIAIVWGLAVWSGDSSSEIEDVPLTTTER